MKNIKQLSIILLLLISSIAYAQKPTVDYLKYKKYTTAQKNAIIVTDTTKVYIVFDKDLDKLQIYKNGAWKEITPQAALDLKADITYVDDELINKVDFTEYANAQNIGVSSWQNKLKIGNYTSPVLGNESVTEDLIEIANSLEGKADATATENELNKKVDFDDYVDAVHIDTESWKDVLDLNDVDNTTDLNKPISTATQNALNLKANQEEFLNPNLSGADPADWVDFLNAQIKSDITNSKADKTNVLEKDNTTAYTPTADYHPATVKHVEEKINSVINGTSTEPTEATILNANATYSDKALIEAFIVDFESVSGFSESEPIYLAEIKDNENGTFRIRFRYGSNDSYAWELVDNIPTGTATFNSTYTGNEANIELDFTNFVSFNYLEGSIDISPVNMDRFINGVDEPTSSIDPNSVVGKIATAKAEAISESATDATTKANDAEQNAKDYTDNELANFSGGVTEQDVDEKLTTDVNIYGQDYTTIQEVVNGVGVVTAPVEESIFLDTATSSDVTNLDAFIKEIKVAPSSGTDILETDEFFILDIRDEGSNVVRIRLRNNLDSNTTVGYFDYTGLTSVQEFTSDNINQNFKVKLDVDNIAYTTATGTFASLPLDMAKLFTVDESVNEPDNTVPNGIVEILAKTEQNAKDYTDTQLSSFSSDQELVNVFPDGDFSDGDADYTFHSNNASFGAGTVALDTNGINWNVTEFQTGNLQLWRYGVPLKPATRYAIAVEYVVNDCNLDQADYDIGFNINLRAQNETGGSLDANIKIGTQMISTQIEGETIYKTEIFETSSEIVETTDARALFNLRYSGLANNGTNLDLTLKSVKMYELGTSSENNKLYDLHPININKLVRGTFDPVPVDAFIESLKKSPYYGRYLITWGHSVVEQNKWQQEILAQHGMIQDVRMYVDDATDGVPDTAIGGSFLVPVIANADTQGAGANHYMKLRNLFQQYNNDYTNEYGKPVHLFMFNFNDKNAGEKYVTGNTYSIPSDVGINDPAWDYDTYGEVDLINNPTETNVPSFGSAYRASLDFVFSIDKGAEIKLVNAYSSDSYPISVRDLHNAVTELMSVEYGLQVLEVDKLWANINEHYWIKDSIHLNDKGAEKMGKQVSKQM
jgi:hypothetical protein